MLPEIAVFPNSACTVSSAERAWKVSQLIFAEAAPCRLSIIVINRLSLCHMHHYIIHHIQIMPIIQGSHVIQVLMLSY